MTTLLLTLGIISAVGIGAALTLWRLLAAGHPTFLSASELRALAVGRSALEVYQPMSRLFSAQDFAFVGGHPGAFPGAARQLRRQRSRILRLYLGDLRREFDRLYAFCRLLAPQSQDPNFASLVTQQALSFYGLWVILQVRCSLGWFLHVHVDTVDLVGSFQRLREAARATALALNPPPALAAGTA